MKSSFVKLNHVSTLSGKGQIVIFTNGPLPDFIDCGVLMLLCPSRVRVVHRSASASSSCVAIVKGELESRRKM